MPHPKNDVHTHSQGRGKKVLVWEVSRLWKLSKDLKSFRIRVDYLKANLNGSCWFGKPPSLGDVVEEMCRVQRADLRYPIILSPKNWVMDGLHRLCKALLQSRPTILAVQFEKLPPPDWIEQNE